jgi:hypothetical protein
MRRMKVLAAAREVADAPTTAMVCGAISGSKVARISFALLMPCLRRASG